MKSIKKKITTILCGAMLLMNGTLPVAALGANDTATPYIALGAAQKIYASGTAIGDSYMWSTNGHYILNGETKCYSNYDYTDNIYINVAMYAEATGDSEYSYRDEFLTSNWNTSVLSKYVSTTTTEAPELPSYGVCNGRIDNYTVSFYYNWR